MEYICINCHIQVDLEIDFCSDYNCSVFEKIANAESENSLSVSNLDIDKSYNVFGVFGVCALSL